MANAKEMQDKPSNMATGKLPNKSQTIDNLSNHLPTGTIFIFQIFSPLFSNDGDCNSFNRLMTAILVGVCGILCVLTCFTDSYLGEDDIVHYCLVGRRRLIPFQKGIKSKYPADLDNSELGISVSDVVHAFMSAFMFFGVTLLDQNTVSCLYHGLEMKDRQVLSVVPVGIGALCSAVFTMFPTNRHGVGYQMTPPDTRMTPPDRPEQNAPDSENEV